MITLTTAPNIPQYILLSIISYDNRYISILINITVINFMGSFVILNAILFPALSEDLFLYKKRFTNNNTALPIADTITPVAIPTLAILNIIKRLDIFTSILSNKNPEL